MVFSYIRFEVKVVLKLLTRDILVEEISVSYICLKQSSRQRSLRFAEESFDTIIASLKYL